MNEIEKYCLNCLNKPCSAKGCPLQNDIPAFIHEKDYKKAFEILCKTTVLPAICGRICPHSKQCQASCVKGIKGKPVSIGKYESFIGDISIKENYEIPKKSNDEYNKNADVRGLNNENNIEDDSTKLKQNNIKKVAIIGSGPSGLTCGAFLAQKGIDVTIYEKCSNLGGLLLYGIPDFRLDRKIISATISKILALGIKVKLNQELGKDFSIEDLCKKYDRIVLAIGSNEPQITLKGENVLSGNKLLEQINFIKYEEYKKNNANTIHNNNNKKLDIKENNKKKSEIIEQNKIPNFKNKDIAVSGGGNVAIDIARTLKRLGANVKIIYRRQVEQMPAEKEELEIARQEGIEFLFQNNILSVDSENKQIECIKTKLVLKEGEDRLSPVNIEDSNYKLKADYVILATGSKTNEKLLNKEKIEVNQYGYVKIDSHYKTSNTKVYSSGDVTGSKATVAWAARTGRDVAYQILKELENE